MNQPSPSTTPPTVAVSYAWKEEAQGPNRKKVEDFCARLEQNGIRVVRDVNHVQYGQPLLDFVNQLAEHDHLCIFLSKAYLKSEWCMREIHAAWKRSLSDSGRFRRRVRIWLMPGLSIKTAAERTRWTRYWGKESKSIKRALAGLRSTQVISEIESQKAIDDFSNDTNAILHHVHKHLIPSDFNGFAKWAAQVVKLGEHSGDTSKKSNPSPRPSSRDTKAAGALNSSLSSPVGGIGGTGRRPDSRDFGRILREVFPRTHQRLLDAVKPGSGLGKLLIARFAPKAKDSKRQAEELMVRFHKDFLDVFPKFIEMYRKAATTADKREIIDLVSHCMFLALAPDFAKDVRRRSAGVGGQTLQLPQYGTAGIRDILRSWVMEHDRVEIFGSNSEDGGFGMDVSPPMRLSQIKRKLMKGAGIDHARADADVLLKARIRLRHRLKDPIYITISSPTLLSEIRSQHSPLKQLLVFVLDKQASIRPRTNDSDFDIDADLLIEEFRKIVASS